MTRLAPTLLLVGWLISGCTTDVPDVPPGFALAATAERTSGITNKTSRCQLLGQFGVPDYDSLPASFTMDLRVSRDVVAHGSIEASRDTIFTDVPVTTSAPDSVHLALHFGPPLNDSLVALVPPQLANGVLGGWTCSANFPFASDSLLDAHGYDLLPAPTGTWALSPNLIVR